MKLKTGVWLLAVSALVAGCAPATPKAQHALPIGDGQTTTRPGYEGATDPDPAPIKEKPNPQGVQLAGKPVIEACNLLSWNDLTALGVQVDSRPDPNIVTFQRTYLVGDGSGPLDASTNTYSRADGLALNKCTYALRAKGGTLETLSVAVSQPTYVPSATGAAAAYDGVQPSLSVGAVRLFSQRRSVPEPDASGEAAVVLGDTVASFDFNLKGSGNAGKLQDIAKRVAQNLQTQTDHPAGPSTIGYSSPVFPEPVAQPCPLLTPDVVSPAIGADASPLVAEMPATAVGDLMFPHDPQQHNYVAIECERGTGEDDELSRKALDLRVTSFLSDQGAREYVEDTAGAHGGQAASAPIGDESKIMTDPMSVKTHGVLIFRKGRFAFELELADHDGHPDGLTLDEANTLLVPAGQKIAQSFRGA